MNSFEIFMLVIAVLLVFVLIATVIGLIAIACDRFNIMRNRRRYEDTHAVHPKIRDYDGGE